MTDLFAPFALALSDRDAAARAAKAAGGKVVGYVGATVPVELVVAAGAFPLRLAADAAATPHADRYMEALFDPVVRGVFEACLDGRYGFLDAIALPRTSDSAQRLYYYLCEARRMGEKAIPEPLLYDLLHTPWYSSAEYNLARTEELAANLARVTGRPLGNLGAAIAAANRRREALQAFAGLRRDARVRGSDAQQVFAAAGVMPAEAFDAALADVLAADLREVPGHRIVLAGSGHMTNAVHLAAERQGGNVVGDFHDFGELMIGRPVDEAAAPIRALASHYHRDVASSRTFPQSPQRLVDFARAARAEAVVFYFFAEEEALTWEFPAQRRELEALGVPCLLLEDMPPTPSAAVEQRVADFLARLPQGVMA